MPRVLCVDEEEDEGEVEESAESRELMVDIDLDLTAQVLLPGHLTIIFYLYEYVA